MADAIEGKPQNGTENYLGALGGLAGDGGLATVLIG
jgi:hypothetical protein